MTVRNHEGMRKEGSRMYSDNMAKKAYDNKQGRPKKDKVVTPPTKVVVRYLPASMTEEEFTEAVSPLPENDYFCFMNADLSLGANAYCRAYINFKNVEDVFIFRDKFDGYVFVDTKGNEYPAMVEFAPFQKIPKRLAAKKKDARCGTIDNDPDYLAFLELLNNPEPSNLPPMEAVLEEIEAHDRELQANNGFIKVKTPLLEFIEQKKAERLRSKEERKEERRRKEFERKKAREDDRRKKKEYKDPRKRDDYKDERKRDDYKDETSVKVKMNMRDERKTEKIIEEKLEKLSLRIENEEKERGKTEKIIESKIEKISSRIEKEKERIEIEKERQRKSEEIRLEARRQRDRDSEFRREKEKKIRKQTDDEQNDKLKDEDDPEGKSEKISRIDKDRERLEREKERQKRSEEMRQEARKQREKERERREKERQLRKEKEREERLKRQEEKAKIRAEDKSRHKDEYRDDYYEDKYYNTSNTKTEGAKTKRYSEGRRKEERERRLKEEREREKRMRETDKEIPSLENESNEILTIPKTDKIDEYEDNNSGERNNAGVEENKSSMDGSIIPGSDGNKSGSEGNKSAGEGSKYGDGNKSGSEGNTISRGGDELDDDGKKRRDPRTERRIRNKDRPTMALYRPGQSRLAQSRMGKSRDDNQDGGETSSSSPSPVMPSGDAKKEGSDYKDPKDSTVKTDRQVKDDEDKNSGKSVNKSSERSDEGREDDYDDRKSPEEDESEDMNKDTETKKYGQKIFRRSVSRE